MHTCLAFCAAMPMESDAAHAMECAGLDHAQQQALSRLVERTSLHRLLYACAVDASYEADLFGGISRSIEAARADAAAAQAAVDAARVAVAADTTRAYAAAAAKQALAPFSIERREPGPRDVLCQHILIVACSAPFRADDLFAEFGDDLTNINHGGLPHFEVTLFTIASR